MTRPKKFVLFFLRDISLAIIFFIILLNIPLPISILSIFHTYSPGLLILLIISYYLGFSIPPHYRRLAVFSLTFGFASLTLSYLWHTGYSDSAIIGGVLPYKDSFFYYNGARFLLMGDRIPGGTLAATFRPLFPSFFAGILFLFKGNILVTQIALVMLTSLAISSSTLQIYSWLGKFPATVFVTLLYLFIQPLTGYFNTEAHGLILGAIAFNLLIDLKGNRSFLNYLLAISTLVVAISTRAGTFFALPFVAIWSGYHLQETKRFSWKHMLLTILIISVVLVSSTYIFSYITTEPSAHTFGNFSYSLYGQVMGGLGWTSANELTTSNTQEITQIAIQHFLAHPSGFFIGSLKAIRDFFMPSGIGVFSFISPQGITVFDTIIWGIAILLWLQGIIRTARKFSQGNEALLLLIIIGFLLSIPFLPPIDGGRRFYTSTIPFFFAVIAYSLHLNDKPDRHECEHHLFTHATSGIASILILALTFILPTGILLYNNGKEPHPATPACPTDLTPFAVQVYPESYISLTPDHSEQCGVLPNLCLDDFQMYGREADTDDFHQAIIDLAAGSVFPTTIMPGIEIVQGGLHYFVDQHRILEQYEETTILTGCASPIRTTNQSIYLIEEISP